MIYRKTRYRNARQLMRWHALQFRKLRPVDRAVCYQELNKAIQIRDESLQHAAPAHRPAAAVRQLELLAA